MTDERQDLATTDETERSLLDRPQRLGLLPTPWFWNNRENWRLVRVPLLLLMAALLVLLPLTALPIYAAVVLPPALAILGLGLFERYVRRRAEARRRELVEATQQPALGPGSAGAGRSG